MTQSRLGSLIESIVNIIIGYGIAIVSQVYIFAMFDIHLPIKSNLYIGLWFTLISLIRSYVIRRWFNAYLHRASQYMANPFTREQR